MFDKTNKGNITKEELKDVLGRLGDMVTDEIIDSIMASADTTGDGTITQTEFMALFA